MDNPLDATNYGSLGLSLQEAIEEIQQDETFPFLPDHVAQSILKSLGTAVQDTAKEEEQEEDAALTDDVTASLPSQKSKAVITANVQYYNRFGDKWSIALDQAQLKMHHPSLKHQQHSSETAAAAAAPTKQRRRTKTSEPLHLPQLQLLLYRERFE